MRELKKERRCRDMQIALCDDEAAELNVLECLCKQYDMVKKFKIVSFSSAAELLKASKKMLFDIILLDIEMEKPTGFEVAQELVKHENPPIIIFATKSQAYCVRGYGIAFRYLVKPIQWDDFRDAIDAATMEIEANRLMLDVENGKCLIPVRDIIYIETYDHSTIVYTTRHSYTVRIPLSELASRLPRRSFVSPQKSYLVNMYYILSTTPKDMTLTSGAVIPISRRKRAEFNECLNAFLGR